ncbi:hydroxyethylthiazole kinase [Agromyces aerolatus]|uniref:hydroxyethylthiazole kinase n=1 Tax=Agromyces sp. LY-1074 TaxID=3074080 RepID=UPI0028586187|nr:MULTISPECIES: hydroxyethylthiazole kinase [unclassified Agromyces]MDR5698555.1 hydroxyethylthiazole kinase [Agromyces sp. LY-1074]MDR5704849.1 hydroxyethylthiazole kinase [Agromyces sp. LY-1358]
MRDRLTVNHAQHHLERLREASPLTHCITNSVVTNFTANALLAIGAAPAMVDIVGEAGPFARVAGAVLVNLGTPTPEQRDAAREAVAGTSEARTPWVLDPVAIGALPIRTALAHELVAQRPTVVRGNASEILALAGEGAGGRGVDAADSTDAAAEAAEHLARTYGSVVAVSGPVDLITDGTRTARVSNGDPLLTRVTGGGCALGATMAAFLAVAPANDVDGPEQARFDATVAATLAYTVAAELAAERSNGPGTFAAQFLDALAALTPARLGERARVTVTSLASTA